VVTRLGTAVGKISRHSAVRFLIVGGLSVAIDTGTLFVLHGLLGVWLPLATAVSYLVSVGVNFALNRLWTFDAHGDARWHLLRYALLLGANLALTVVLVQVLTWMGLPYLVSKLCTTAVLAVSNYFISRRWVFN
jgi:putative flippase GtrA